jgi:hypothetical protein
MNVTVTGWYSHHDFPTERPTAWVVGDDKGETIAAYYSFDAASLHAAALISGDATHAPAATETALEATQGSTEGTQPQAAPKRRRNAVVRPLRRQNGGHLQE